MGRRCSAGAAAACVCEACSACLVDPAAAGGAAQAPPTALRREVDLGGGVFVCGDHRDTATFDGALLSGRRAAEALLAGGR